MDVGIRLPLASHHQGGWSRFGDWGRRIESAGFDAVWCVDHLLAAQYVFGSASLEPLVAMGYLCGATERVTVGVSVLIAPLRPRMWVAKQLGTLSALAGERVVIGLGAGWDEHEFAASGVDRATRGDRLDAVLDDLLTARRRGSLSIDGYAVEPSPSTWRGIVVGGGSSATVADSASMNPRVARRIARADGWFVRSSCPPEALAGDRAQIDAERAALGLGSVPVTKSCFLHVSEAADDERALAEQVEAMTRIGWRGTPDELAGLYPHGAVDRMLAWFRAEAAAGVSTVVLHPVGPFEEQVDRIERLLLPALHDIG